MSKNNFHNLSRTWANQVETALDGNEAETGAFLLVHALTAAQDHDADTVQAYARGCDDNDFAEAMTPMLMRHTPKTIRRLRGDLCDIFENGADGICAGLIARRPAHIRVVSDFERMLDAAMSAIEPHKQEIEAPDAGLMRVLGLAKREGPQLVIERARGRGDATVYRRPLVA